MQVVVHVDGGARGNPGPAAAAAVVSAPDGRVLDEAAVTLGHATNNVAEYRGLLLGLERAAALGATEVEVVNDSELVARQVDGAYKVKQRGAQGRCTRRRARRSARLRALVDPLRAARAERRRRRAGQPRARRRRGRARRARCPSRSPRAARTTRPTCSSTTCCELQRPITPGAHDELLFIVVHQAYELWFKLILHELTAARDDLLAARPHVAAPRLRRVVAVERLLLDQLDVLETMGPEGFLEFRDPLAPASGLPVAPVPRDRVALGRARDVAGRRRPAGGPVALRGVPRRARAAGGRRRRGVTALADLYRDHAGDPLRAAWHDVAELLVDHDERTALWRHHHTLMAAREIGTRMGTGGSRGRRVPARARSTGATSPSSGTCGSSSDG